MFQKKLCTNQNTEDLCHNLFDSSYEFSVVEKILSKLLKNQTKPTYGDDF